MDKTPTKWPWFERQFSFDFPPSKLRDIIERLSGTSLRISATLSLDRAIRTAKVDDTWSIQENVGHLIVLEPLWLGRVNDILDGKPQLRETDLNNQATTDAEFNATQMAPLIDRFGALRSQLIQRLETLPDSVADRTATHPRLGTPMRIVDIAFFVSEHDDYHLARITELRRLLTDPR